MAKEAINKAFWLGTALSAAMATIVGCPAQDAEFRETTGTSGNGGAGGGSGGSGGVGGSGGAGGAGIQECATGDECPDTGNECVTRTCISGLCGTDFVDDGIATMSQTAGDCKLIVCDGKGGSITVPKATDLPNDQNECTDDVCVGSAPTSTNFPEGHGCNQNAFKCDGKGACVECILPADCPSNVCSVQNKCLDAACGDGIKNGTESDQDCGGTCGGTCQPGKTCGNALDCQSGVCDSINMLCLAPTCIDLVKNGVETDIDCGGGAPCNACSPTKTCVVGSDCDSGVCGGGVCKPPACDDGVQNGAETDIDCGGMDCQLCPTVLMVAGGASGGLLGEYHPTQPWTTTPTTEKSSYTPGVVITATGKGVTTTSFSNTPLTVGGPLRYSLWNAGTGFDPFNTIAAGVTARGTLMNSSLLAAHVVFYGDNSKHYYASYKMGQWMPTAESVAAGGSPSFGPSVPAITTLGNDVYIAYAGDDGNLYDQARVGSVWGSATLHPIVMSPGPTMTTPSIVALTAGPELMIVFGLKTGGQLYSTTRTNGVWEKPVAIPNALSTDPVALLAIPGGNAIVAFRGTDGRLYTSRFAAAKWSQAAAPIMPSPSIASKPALCPGVGGSGAELVYISSAPAATAGMAFHSRLLVANWSPVVSIGGANLTYVSITSGP